MIYKDYIITVEKDLTISYELDDEGYESDQEIIDVERFVYVATDFDSETLIGESLDEIKKQIDEVTK